MKTRKCRLTQEQLSIHEKAVRLRKMTDEQLIKFIEAEKSRAVSEATPLAETSRKEYGIPELLNDLEGIKGIGRVTVQKIRRFVNDAGHEPKKGEAS